MRRNKNFTGRTSILTQLCETCFPGGASGENQDTVALFSIGGLGGIGKTQVALEFSYWVRDNMPEYSIYWISALSMDTFNQSCWEILDQLGMISGEERKDLDAKKRLKDYLSRSPEAGKWLLVVDNADDVSLVKEMRPYIPHSESGITLVTTRTEDVAWEISTSPALVNLDVMSTDEAQELLKRSLLAGRVPNYSEESGKRLVVALDMLPLAITQAAAYLNRNRLSIQEYLNLLQGREEEARRLLSFAGSSAEQWPAEKQQRPQYNAVMTTWLVSLDQMKMSESGTGTTRGPMVKLLMFLSRVEPKAIPKRMLPEVGGSAAVLANTIGTLLGYAMLTKRDGQVYDMHSLVQLAIRSWVAREGLTDEARTWALECLEDKMYLEEYYSKASRVVWSECLPHALRVLTESTHKAQSYNRAWLAHWVGYCLAADGRWDEALEWTVVYAEAIAAIYGCDSDEYVKAQCRLADAYLDADRPTTALSLLEYCIARWHETRPADDKWLVHAQMLHGRTLRKLGHARQAVKVLEKLVSPLPTDHPEWGHAHNDLALACNHTGQHDRAVRIFEQVLAATQHTLPADDALRIDSKYGLALACLSTGKAPTAVMLLKNVLAAEEAQYPPHHQALLFTQQALAQAYLGVGDPTQALDIIHHVAEMNTKTLPPQHADSLTTQHWLAEALLAMAKVHQAVSALERIIQYYPRTTLSDLEGSSFEMRLLRDVYEALGDLDNVERLGEMLAEIDSMIEEAERPHGEQSEGEPSSHALFRGDQSADEQYNHELPHTAPSAETDDEDQSDGGVELTSGV
ncbi:uncharacterized protein B0I36DRAFT_40929 [Microdochium trichocladiopsis]|uniref:NB-ARC domain-containing protein n=1 Tax=Microdochium trichocladiopsis TaxID=1682393 RepID=A0A9P8XWG0_9PEZI|nr:uncharacterized protein B0I36DRAFT_40929 [Microdochium trichocladiopsis]KAH7018576.1 hypothetical protein B0I36DRAFT_40929 [Microdochium trichocladiopsis]